MALLGPHGVRRRRSPWLQAVHGMPFIETGAVRLDALLIVAHPVVCQPSQEVILLACLRAHLMQGLQCWPVTRRGSNRCSGHLHVHNILPLCALAWLQSMPSYPVLILSSRISNLYHGCCILLKHCLPKHSCWSNMKFHFCEAKVRSNNTRVGITSLYYCTWHHSTLYKRQLIPQWPLPCHKTLINILPCN